VIRTADFPPHVQKLQGFVVGFKVHGALAAVLQESLTCHLSTVSASYNRGRLSKLLNRPGSTWLDFLQKQGVAARS
jgi:hypothetical protein